MAVRLGKSLSAFTFLAFAPVIGAGAQQAPILQPGAPGQAPRLLSAEQAVQIANTRFSEDDVRYMQAMIVHHQQAVDMAELVKGRTNRQAVIDAARRINASQDDEMAFMRSWLGQRGRPVSSPAAMQDMHGAHAGHAMPAVAPVESLTHSYASMGMATPQQMAALAAAKGTEFDRQFLERMIHHHQGAVTMSQALLRRSGSAADPVLYDFVNEVINEQKAEIKRMTEILAGLRDDPRSTLKPGFSDAGVAASNMRLLASLPKPTGFFDPKNPMGIPFPKAAKKGAPAKPANLEDGRFPALSFSNTDMAFSGNLLAVGNYHGFNLYRLTADPAPQLLSSVICPGGQGDVSIVGNLLIMSVEQTRGRVDCGREGVSADVSAERFRGIRIFDISNPMLPRQVGAVQTCRGSHTHSVVSSDPRSLIVYVSGTASVRRGEELPGCVSEIGDPRTALFRIDVVEIPVANPGQSRIIDSPAVFADPTTGAIAGLWRGGTHGEGTQDTSRTDQCHDITVFPTRKLAAGACSGNGIIFDISNPRKPRRIDAVSDPTFSYWHSATFNNDGTKVLFTDEWGGGGRARCRVQDPRTWGANAIYNIVDGKLRYQSHYKLPAAQGEAENCVAHNGSIIPVPGRDLFVQAWYQGGLSVMDFTDSQRPVEIAYFDRGPLIKDQLLTAGFWSSYWYNGRIYATEIARGLDILALTPSASLTANEIAAAAIANGGNTFNPQQQFPVTWPDHPLVALAYLDQLERSGAYTAAATGPLRQALGAARTAVEGRQRNASLAAQIEAAARSLPRPTVGDPKTLERIGSLSKVVGGVAAALR